MEIKYSDEELNSFGKEILKGNISFTGNSPSGENRDKISKLLEYINEKIKDEKNIDYNFKYINNNNYIKNYIGFKDLENAKDFDKIDFSIYKEYRYPGGEFILISLLSLIFFFLFVIFFYVLLMNAVGRFISKIIVIIVVF